MDLAAGPSFAVQVSGSTLVLILLVVAVVLIAAFLIGWTLENRRTKKRVREVWDRIEKDLWPEE